MQEEAVQYYLAHLDSDDAVHRLMEAGSGILPLLEAEFSHEPSPDCRATLVYIIRQVRDPRAIGFLSRALDDPAPAVWQEALNGLVVMGGGAAKEALCMALARSTGSKRDWIDEAIAQIAR